VNTSTVTPLSSILMVFGGSFIGSFAAVFLKGGADRLHRELSSIWTNWRLMAGIGLFVLSSLLYLKGIKRGELTVLYPMVSFGYVWTLLWSRLFFNEPITKNKFMGLGLIALGILLLAFSKKG
jgi:drug/metabolite transporter (DMT)-like permease